MPTPPSTANDSPRVRRARQIARFFDDYYVDPVLGFLLPGVGDALSALMGLYVVGLAFRERLPLVVIARMLINVAVDAIVGVIPFVGDLFDLTYRAHSRNLALVEARHRDRAARASDWAFVLGAAALALAAITLPVVVAVLLVRRLLAW